MVAFSVEVEIDGINYNVYTDAKTAEVIEQSSKNSGDIVIPATVEYEGVVCDVTSIGNFAYFNCRGLKSITIPNSVKSIGGAAFFYCSSLTSISIPQSVTSIGKDAFTYCSGIAAVHISDLKAWCEISFTNSDSNPLSYSKHLFLNGEEVKDLIIPNSLTSMGNYAFSGCSGLTSVTIPNSVTNIGESVFYGCSGLTSVIIPESVTSIGNQAFYNCSSLTQIEINSNTIVNSTNYSTSMSFKNIFGEQVTKYIIGKDVTGIGAYAFSGCSGLTSITIPKSVTNIGESAFSYCSGLTSITIPESVTSIGEKTFYNCTGLPSVTIPESVTNIGASAFYGCSCLTSVHISDLKAWCELTFFDRNSNPLFYAKHLYLNDKEVEDMVIPNGVTSIGASVFYNCTGLTSVIIPESVTSIGNQAFYNCSSLTQIEINSNTIVNSTNYSTFTSFKNIFGEQVTKYIIGKEVTNIGAYAFSGCGGLTSITIPESVTNIGAYAFSGCGGLTAVHIPNLKAWCEISFSNSDSNPLFYAKHLYLNDKEVEDMVIPNSLTSIGNYAFAGCSGLTSITIPESVTNIGESVFYGCSGLTSVHISDLKAWCELTFSDIYSNPLFYAKHLYLNDKEVDDMVIPNGVTSIGASVFYNCTGLTSVIIPSSVTGIGAYAFAGCSGLTSITIPESVTNIGNQAFYCCNSLTSITIPNSVTRIETGAFVRCSGLTSVHVSDLKAWCEISFSNSDSNPLSYAKHLYLNSEEVKDLVIPNSLTSIGNYTFAGCSGLTSVTIPNSVTSIGESAFYGCSGLTFIIIGNSVKNIGPSAFASIKELTDVYCYANNIPKIESNSFQDSKIDFVVLHVPADKVAFYEKNSLWNQFVGIVPIGEDDPDIPGDKIRGDANGDSLVDVSDVVAIVNRILGEPADGFDDTAADINGDGKIDVDDIVAVVNIILEK